MKISIIGTGNVASAFARAFLKAGHQIVCVYGRDSKKATSMAKIHQSTSVSTLEELNGMTSDIIFIALNDDAITEISKNLGSSKAMVVHTSGSVNLAILVKKHKRCGVFYPLETFSPGNKINFKTMPVCIETNLEKDLQFLLQLAHSVSRNVYVMNSEQRLQVHLAAVIANNFSNHLFVMAEKILEKNNLSFDLLRPIILSSAKNLQHHSPSNSQTGPAKRQNEAIINKHLALLKKSPSWQKLYELLSEDIGKISS